MQSVTPIEMLPDLEDLERGNHRGNNSQFGSSPGYQTTQILSGEGSDDQVKINNKFIRGRHHPPHEQAGMTPYNEVPISSNSIPQHEQISNESPLQQQQSNLTKYNMPDGTPSCLDVAEHIANCPICSKFYCNDKTIYIIAIVVLAIICVLLLKKVLDV